MPKALEGENAAATEADLNVNTIFGVKGKVVLVTGGGSGIGAMISSGYVQNGAKVYVASRKDISGYAAELTSKGPGSCVSLKCDITKDDQCQAMLKAIEDANGQLNVLVNNSGTNFSAPLGNYSRNDFSKVMQTNVDAVFALTQMALPLIQMNASKEDPARVINIASINGVRAPGLDTFAYSTSKAAVRMLSQHLASALGRSHVTVNTINPGPFMSRMLRGLIQAVGEENTAATSGLNRLGGPVDVAGACLFLSSAAGSYLTGTEFALDGGALVHHMSRM